MQRCAPAWMAIVLLAGAAAPAAWAAQSGQGSPPASEAARDAARNERAALRERLEAIQREVAKTEQQKSEAADALKASESAISAATRRLAQIGQRQGEVTTELGRLEREIKSSETNLAAGQAHLADLLRKQYASGGVSPWSALLSGDDPQQTGRTLGYLGYVSRARAAAVQAISREIAELQRLRTDAESRRTELTELAGQEEIQREELVRQQAERKRVLAQIGERLTEQRNQAERLTSDDARLSGLISDINRALVQQRREAEAARRQAEQAARLAREQAEREQREAAARQHAQSARLAREQQERERQLAQQEPLVRSTFQERGTGGDQAVGSPSVQPAPTPTIVARIDPAPVVTPSAPIVREPAGPADFASLRGRLSLPARGQVVGRFGAPRSEGGTWRGIFIRAPQAAPVQAVAAGTVVFSGWLRGFGNLLILDHGSEYLSVYGNNEAILKEVGERVARGETVASSGASGGQPESGIYFELRHRGQPVDPLQWVRSR